MAAATITFLQVAGDATDLSVYTFTSQNFGTATADRYIICGVSARAVAISPDITSLTIGGITATRSILAHDILGLNTNAIYIAAVPSGASGTVVVTFDQTQSNCDISLYATTGVSSTTPTDTGSSTADPGTTNLDINAGGIAVAEAKQDSGTGTCNWIGLTERYDQLDANGNNISGASDAFATTQTNLTVTADFTAVAVRPIFVAVSYPGGGGVSGSNLLMTLNAG